MTDRKAMLAREAEFHDRAAEHADRAAPPAPPGRWDYGILAAIAQPGGNAIGGAVCDYGCGDGELALHLLAAGATNVTGFDISPAMVDVARARAELHFPNARTSFVVGDGHATGFPDNAFDLVLGKFILHHLDLDDALTEVARILRPGGRAVFMETSALNPALAFARRHVVHGRRFGTAVCGTDDEHPLDRAAVITIRRHFPDARVDFPAFFLFHVFDRNVLRFRSRFWNRRLWRADRFVERRLPVLGPLSYYVRISFTRR